MQKQASKIELSCSERKHITCMRRRSRFVDRVQSAGERTGGSVTRYSTLLPGSPAGTPVWALAGQEGSGQKILLEQLVWPSLA